MIAKVTFVACVLWMATAFFLMNQLNFLAPYKHALWHLYSREILSYGGLLFFNLFGVVFMILRKFFFKDTGKKLEQLEKNLRTEERLLTQIDPNP
jgi:hypothetical protein